MRALIFVVITVLSLTGCESVRRPAGDPGVFAALEKQAVADKYRLVWNDDPMSTMTILWDQLAGEAGTVYYGTKDCGRSYWKYPNRQNSESGMTGFFGMNTCCVRLKNLDADQTYYFVIKDEVGVSERFYFITAPKKPKPFTFIAGGDTKSDEPALQAGWASNKMVAKLRPLFVVFNGSFTSGNGMNPENWQRWLTDWDLLTTTADGRKFPIVPVQGSHEYGDKAILNKLFDAPFKGNNSTNIYYSLSFGGRFFHIIALNSEIEPGGDQRNWLEADLKEHQDFTFKIAGYHRPFSPHSTEGGKRNNEDLYQQWAELFYRYGLDLSMDADSHVHKITYPVRPSASEDSVDGFVRDDEKGTVFIGEGSWGAVPGLNNNNKPWTMQSGSFNQFKWIHVRPENRKHPAFMELFTVITSQTNDDGTRSFYVDAVECLTERNVFKIPENIRLFTGNGSAHSVKYPFHLNDKGPVRASDVEPTEKQRRS
ncbi:MAG: hypothetical protein MUC65_08560 [Pontiellaceae bacterium]|nr:hypothetical protein [Pontiellaceae bacterium]